LRHVLQALALADPDASGVQRKGAATLLVHRHLEGGAGSQGRLLEVEGGGPAGKLGIRPLLPQAQLGLSRLLEKFVDGLFAERQEIDDVFGHVSLFGL